jgi:hypothetical protein
LPEIIPPAHWTTSCAPLEVPSERRNRAMSLWTSKPPAKELLRGMGCTGNYYRRPRSKVAKNLLTASN